MSSSIPALAERSSGHQNREARLIQDPPCDPTKHPLVQFGVTVGAHHERIGAKGRCLGEQNATHLLTTGRQKLHVYFRAVKQQVAYDVRPRRRTELPG